MKKICLTLYRAVLLMLCVTLSAAVVVAVVVELPALSVPVSAETVQAIETVNYEDGEYTPCEDGWVLNHYNGNEREVTIPDEIDGVPVTEISAVAFSGNTQIEVVNIPANIKRIEGFNDDGVEPNKYFFYEYDNSCPGAFASCSNLKVVNIAAESKLCSIGAGAFIYCASLESIKLPEGLCEIGVAAFRSCRSLVSITIPDGIEVIKNETFYYCSSLENVVLPSSLSVIWCSAFEECRKLSEIEFPDSLTMIYDSAFGNCRFREIRISKYLTYISRSAFNYNVELESFYVDEDNPNYSSQDGVLYNKDKKLLYQCPEKKESYIVPATVKEICYPGFNGCNLSQLTLNEGLEVIHDRTFGSTIYLKSLTIPSTVRIIENDAFFIQWGLEEINVAPENQYYESFDGVLFTKDLKELVLYPYKKEGQEYDVPEGVESIRSFAFHQNGSLKQINLPSTFAKAQKNAFTIEKYNPNTLETIEVSDNNKYFSSVDGVLFSKEQDTLVYYPEGKKDEVYIVPDTVKVIADGAIYKQRYIKRLYVPEGVEKIGEYVIFSCENLEYISFPRSLTNVGPHFCLGLPGIKAIAIPGDIESFGGDTFSSVLGEIYRNSDNVFSYNSYNVFKNYDEHEQAGHSYEEQVVHYDAVDYMLYTCTVCGHMEMETHCIHEWDTDYTVDVQPACIETGIMSIHCKKCAAVKNEKIIEAIGHDYEDINIIKPVKCEYSGITERSCKICGLQNTYVVEAPGHDYDEWEIVKAPTCMEKGIKKRVCKRCGHVDADWTDPCGHDYSEWKTSKKETCTEKGLKKRFCYVCGYSDSAEIDKISHKWDWDYTIDTQATCTKEGSKSIHCRTCGSYYDKKVIPATGHDFGEWEILVEPSADEQGIRQRSCKNCGHVNKEEIENEGQESNSGNITDKDTTDKEAADKEVTDKEADDKEADYKDATDKGTTDKGVADKEAANNETSDKDSADKETTGDKATAKEKIKQKQTIAIPRKVSVTVTYRARVLRKRKATFNIAAKAKGKIAYKVTKGSKYISVSRKGLVTIKKKAKKGSYRILITAEETTGYLPAKRYIVIKIT